MPTDLQALSAVAVTSDDQFLGGRLEILQPQKGYRAGIDAVFLAAAVSAKSGDAVLEAGSGVGVAALCLASRLAGTIVTGLEVEPEMVALARQNARRNDLGDRVSFVEADILSGIAAAGLQTGGFDHVMANPPYFDTNAARVSDNALKARAHAFGPEDMDHWFRFMTAALKPQGTMTIIHRAEMLDRLLVCTKGRIGDCRVYPLFPRAGEAASRIILRGTKGSRAALKLMQGMVLHGEGHGFSASAENILRQGASVELQ